MRKILLFFLIISIQSFAANDSLPVTITAKPSAVIPQNSETPVVIRCGRTNFSEEPLVIIDGVPVDASQLKQLNPNDISRIDILKGSSAAAIYGNRAINGLIIITTKRIKHLVIQDADSKSFLEGATVKILPDKNLKEPIVLIADKNGEADLSSLKEEQEYAMEVSCIGYKTKTIRISKTENNSSVELNKEYKKMDSVFIVSDSYWRKTTCWATCSVIRTYAQTDSPFARSSFIVYPNPARKFCTVTLKLLKLVRGKIDVFNSAGQIAQSLNSDGESMYINIPLQKENAGVYFVRLTDAKTKETFSQKLIIQ